MTRARPEDVHSDLKDNQVVSFGKYRTTTTRPELTVTKESFEVSEETVILHYTRYSPTEFGGVC